MRAAFALVFLAAMPGLRANITPAPLFCEHAVLQQGVPIPVWGTAAPGEAVTVFYLDQRRETVADTEGHWIARLDPLSAGLTGTLTIQGPQNTVSCADVVTGEVWLCSGQSNMRWTVREAKDAPREMAAARLPQIRQYAVPCQGSAEPAPADFVRSQWQSCTPETVGDFTAVGYFFAREISREVGTPVGLINASWGGTPIQPWMSRGALEIDPPMWSRLMEGKRKEMERWPANKAKFDEAVREWEEDFARATAEGKPAPPRPWDPGPPDSPQYMPAQLYNGMIAPLQPYAICGVLWYQGEANAAWGPGGAADYLQCQLRLIRGWREAWGAGDFPFYLVQLPNFALPPEQDRTGDSWAFFREAQARCAVLLPNVAMAVTVDAGETASIHPLDKQTVGHRLALIAEARTYGKPVTWTGPTFRAVTGEADGSARVEFDGADGGLCVRGETLRGFTVAGADGKFVPAEARVGGGNVVLISSPAVTNPVAVRYAWSSDPVGCNLYNEAGLPAAPFRTDGTITTRATSP